MARVDERMKPIVDMFAATIRNPKAMGVLSDWKKAIENGVMSFGRKEPLGDDLDFNTLFFVHPNPAYNASLNKIVLAPDIEIAGVITNSTFEHQKFNFLKQEMLIIKGHGKWDYAKNERFKSLRIQDNVTLCIPEFVDSNVPANAAAYTDQIANACQLWLLTQNVKHKN
ncbi:MAG: hypothetical protein GY791_20970 [Alphaproteobacteria bacterium]|nr:hypothetical protein [Alphaproteobacteria bacterium]